MRRLLTGILAALILLTLAACGSEKTDAGNDGKEEDSATVNGVVNRMGISWFCLLTMGLIRFSTLARMWIRGVLKRGTASQLPIPESLGARIRCLWRFLWRRQMRYKERFP
ncbi:MAG: hypothetical protein ACLTYN_11800 [Dysosmobacter welbionis]